MKYRFFVILVFWSTVSYAGTWQDDFSQGLDNWKVEGEQGDWKAQNRECIGESLGENKETSFLVTGASKWKDYTVECQVQILNISGGDHVGLMLHYQKPTNYFWFGVSGAWTRYEVGTANNLVAQELIRVPFGQWITLRAAVKGKTVTCFVDGKEVFKVEGETVGEGKTGFYLFSSNSAFSNFSVSGPQIIDGGPGFAVFPQAKLATTWASVKQGG